MKTIIAALTGARPLAAVIALVAALGVSSADAAATLSTTLSSPNSPALGKLLSGTSGATTFVVTPAGAVSYSGGGTRLLGTSSVTTAQLTITCNGTGSGTNSCSKFSKIVVSLGGQNSSGGRTGTVTGITGAVASGSASVSAINATSFQITPNGGTFSNGQAVTVNVGVTVQFDNTGAGLGTPTSVSYTLSSTGS